jgi:hypothetical protein
MPYEPTAAEIAWQLARMDDDATEADARAVLLEAAADDDDDDEVCRNGKPWSDCTCC